MDAEELVERFQFFDDWQDRYRYLIDLGKRLPPMSPSDQTEATRVKGCMSKVWLVMRPTDGQPGCLDVIADSDSTIVKGLIYVVQTVYSGKTPQQMASADIDQVFTRIGLDQHLSPNRRNGFYSMVERIRSGASDEGVTTSTRS